MENAVLDNAVLPTIRLYWKSPFRFDKEADGWKLRKKGPDIDRGDILRFDPFLEEGELQVLGNIMTERARKLGDTVGQHHAERLLEQQINIPDELRPYILVFVDTVWEHGDKQIISYLSWSSELMGWTLNFACVESEFFNNCLVSRLDRQN